MPKPTRIIGERKVQLYDYNKSTCRKDMALIMFFLLITCYAAELEARASSDLNSCCKAKADGLYSNPSAVPSCSSYCLCVNETTVEKYTCPSGTLFSSAVLDCVPSSYAQCNAIPQPPPINYTHGLTYLSKSNTLDHLNRFFRYQSLRFIPPYVNFREIPGVVTDVEDQKLCSACYAFSSKAAIEAISVLRGRRPSLALSAEQVVDCNPYGQGCVGGYPDDVFEYVSHTGGLTSQAIYPYTRSDEPRALKCRADLAAQARAVISGYEYVPAFNVTALLQAVSNQPVSVNIAASAKSFLAYDGSYIYDDPDQDSGLDLDHSLLIVGYYIPIGYDAFGADIPIINSTVPPPPTSSPSPLTLSPPPPTSSPPPPTSPPLPHSISPPFLKRAPPAMPPSTGQSIPRGPRGSVPYWIAKNSWGTGWGDHGYIYIKMTNGAGIAGMLTTPPVYPVIKNSCEGPNPCGGGTCVPNGESDYDCVDCPAGFVSTKNTDGTATCVIIDVCSSKLLNPCNVGVCTNDNKGKYTCDCPPGYVKARNVDNLPTCSTNGGSHGVSSTSESVSYTSKAGDTCAKVQSLYQITARQFNLLNPGLKCRPLAEGAQVVVGPLASTGDCGLLYVFNKGDTCQSLAKDFETRSAQIALLNPDIRLGCPGRGRLDVQPGTPICVVEGKSMVQPQCGEYYSTVLGDTCASIRAQQGLTPYDFFSLNPGLFCGNLRPGAQICVATFITGRTGCYTSKFITVVTGQRCRTIAARHTNNRISILNRLNGNGFRCLDLLTAGRKLCVLHL